MDREPSLSVVSWNVHRAVGGDGRRDPERVERGISTEIAPLRPNVLALQEADADDPPHAGLLSRDRIERVTGLHSVHGPQHMRRTDQSGGYLGNILFLAPEIAVVHRRIIDLPGRCPRAAVMVEARSNRDPVRIVSCHLSLAQWLRAVQLRLIGQVIAPRERMQTILLGDLNEWRPWGGAALARRLSGIELHGAAVATFPVGRPVLPLDRVLSEKDAVCEAVAINGPTIRAASDHRPLFARVSIAGGMAA